MALRPRFDRRRRRRNLLIRLETRSIAASSPEHLGRLLSIHRIT